MAAQQEMQVQNKQEANQREESTIHGRAFLPLTDIYETEEALTLVMEMPGVEKRGIDVSLQDDVLRVQGRIDFSKYEGLRPVYTEYNIGNYSRVSAFRALSIRRRSVRRPKMVCSRWCCQKPRRPRRELSKSSRQDSLRGKP